MRGYPEYKDSGVEWLGEIPSHWQQVTLGRCGGFSGGCGFPHEYQGKSSGELPFYKVGDTNLKGNEKYLEKAENYVTQKIAIKLGATINRPGGIMFPKVGAALLGNKRRILSISGITDNNTMVFSPKEKDNDYWYYWLSILDFGSLSNPGPVPSVNESQLKVIKVVRPPLAERKSISNYLDRETARIDKLITEKQNFIKLLKEKRQALISHVVTKGLDPDVKMRESGIEWIGEVPEHWAISKLSYRHEVLLGKMLDDKKITGKHLGRYLRNTDVQWDKINDCDLPQMDFKPSEVDRYQVRKGDLLVCEGGEIGRCAIWEKEKSCFYQKALHRLRPYSNKKDHTRFLFYVISDAVNQERFISRANKATIAHLPAETFRQYRFAFPLFEEQKEIADYLDCAKNKYDSLLDEVNVSIEYLKEHRTALISAAVTGKIDVRDQAKESAT